MSRIHDLVVIGGGVHGCTTALFAARGGMSVALVERAPLPRGVGRQCRHADDADDARGAHPYALRAHAMWADARNWLGHDVGVVVCDGLSLAFTEREEELLSYRAGKRREAGRPSRSSARQQRSRSSPALAMASASPAIARWTDMPTPISPASPIARR